MTKAKKIDKKDEKIAELTADLQRLRADFENYRKQAERERDGARKAGAERATLELLPVIDNVERAIAHIPEDISDHPWVKGIGGLIKQLDKTLAGLGVSRINSKSGAVFNPDLHQAVQFDEEAEGEKEVIESELQPGYMLNDRVIRHAMVRVTRK
ncbi:nucleotide exchange factor GrpE [Candidatus Nomurabacteria bacterium]|nr:nucleotide exchange factor GrpE [Candidatus Nomurabacteria bacterium]